MKRALLGLAIAALLPFSAQAADNAGTNGISYNYVEGGYVNADWAEGDFDGLALAGSFGFAEHWYGSATYRQVDENDFDVTLSDTTINLGWHTAIQQNVDFFAEIGYANLAVEFDGDDDDSDGYRAGMGVRGLLTPHFELQGKVTYTDINDVDEAEFGFGATGIWHINQTWGVTGTYEHTKLLDESMDVWGLGIRASF